MLLRIQQRYKWRRVSARPVGLISAGGILLRARSWPYFCGGAKQNPEHTHLQFKSYHYDVTLEFSIFLCVFLLLLVSLVENFSVCNQGLLPCALLSGASTPQKRHEAQ